MRILLASDGDVGSPSMSQLASVVFAVDLRDRQILWTRQRQGPLFEAGGDVAAGAACLANGDAVFAISEVTSSSADFMRSPNLT